MTRMDFYECPQCLSIRLIEDGDFCDVCKMHCDKVVELNGVSSCGEREYRIDDNLAYALHEVTGRNVSISIRNAR